MAERDEIESIFSRQRAGAAERRQRFGLEERKGALAHLRQTIERRERDIVAALRKDFGKSEPEVILTEILPVLQEIRHAMRHLKGWMRERRVAPTLATFGTSARIRPEPRGVCLIIAPWNYPFNLALGPLVSALAAGNSAVVKPSEMTPATAKVIAEIITETFPPELVAVVQGDKEVAQRLLEEPFDHIFFTGSPQVGKIVMAAAAKHLSSVTLELGGKSPTIVGPGADLEKAARWIAFGKFVNAGQTCIAPDHVFVHRSVEAEFAAAVRAAIGRSYGEDARASGDYARIVNEQHATRLRRLLDDAVGKGARITFGGGGEGTYLAPTLVEAITPQMEIDEEEIFGPVLPLMAYDDLGSVIERINSRPKPLALYIFEKDPAFAEEVISRTSSGGVGVNLTTMQYTHPRLPFGGVNNSGIGAGHGYFGFQAFSHEKPILTDRRSMVPMLFPPYTTRVERLIRIGRRFLG
ncbi:aldehyde dehydrogenase (NAD+) [Pseudorhizobium tarimense]|uniref:Aldehyde dehydrogenase n=1 Tax=Pseudorhizobium tarimense TaxID=1079109 RepID=A0ABV2H303_9HYPH|nr:aldehyde dehydrogenase family protein [Pseudorhizobium tarimense]MCJ8518096.1 aldehyde dehydrogenase family protein [Pseudorhizobium tarimense]